MRDMKYNLLVLLEEIKRIALYDQLEKNGRRRSFYIWDICDLKGFEGGQALAAEWMEFAQNAITDWGERCGVGIFFVPVFKGEVAGREMGLKHESASDWHFSKAGQFYHVQSFLNMVGCGENIMQQQLLLGKQQAKEKAVAEAARVATAQQATTEKEPTVD